MSEKIARVFCPSCKVKAIRIMALEAEVNRLKRQNARLKKQLARVRQYAAGVLHETDKVLKQKSGVPRAKWAYTKGAAYVAHGVLRVVGGGS